jgi:hypothetical protein
MSDINQTQDAWRTGNEPIDYDYYRARAHALREQAKRDVPRALFQAVRRLLTRSRPIGANAKISLR